MIIDYPLGVWPGLHAAIEVHPHAELLAASQNWHDTWSKTEMQRQYAPAKVEQPSEVVVTAEMIAAGLAADKPVNGRVRTEQEIFSGIYRAMAAAAPHPPPLVWTKDLTNGVMTPQYPEREIIAARDREIQMSKAELCALRRKNQQWYDIWSKTEVKRQELEAANTALRSIAADLEDVQRQNVRLEVENAWLRATFGPRQPPICPIRHAAPTAPSPHSRTRFLS